MGGLDEGRAERGLAGVQLGGELDVLIARQSVSDMDIYQLGDEMQRWAAHTVWATVVVGDIRAEQRRLEDQLHEAAVGQKGRSKEDRVYAAIIADPQLAELHKRYVDNDVRLARAEANLEAYRIMRDTLSRQIEVRRLEFAGRPIT